MRVIKPGYKRIRISFDYGEHQNIYTINAKHVVRFSHGRLIKVDKRYYSTYETMFIILSKDFMDTPKGKELNNEAHVIDRMFFEYKDKIITLNVPSEIVESNSFPTNYAQYNVIFENGDLGISFRGPDRSNLINLIGSGVYNNE